MTSSMLTGERRWASARRTGMTVLGKVAVPKPINLPSQRLENHGLDPTVEIVPKGTHSWGSRQSSSTSNAWGSSLSPNTDGGTGSPSHLSGRPSSGGSGTRPSTAGSDRAHEPITNAWGSNSRPSSSSGSLTSNQTSHTALRPHSAETRPGSSQLSRFAEHLSDTSVAWGAAGTTEKLGVTSSKNDGFSLTSGDFPTLGSEKENSGKNADSQDHGSRSHPDSSSAVVVSGKEGTGNSAGEVFVNSSLKSGAAGPWRRENSLYGEDGARPNEKKWHADPQPYPNSSIPPQHYDSWHGPRMNNHPGGVWYRGPPGGPPFGSPVAPPGGFPMEPFPYYRPQIPPPGLANPQPVPPPGAGPRGPRPKNGDMYRPHMHDAYIRPSMPLRPGFYPGPVPYESYFGPPMGYCNSNERDVPFMGMAMGPAAYNRYPGPNVPDPGNSHGRTSGYGPCSKALVSEQVEAVHPQDTQGLYKVLLKQHDAEGKDEKQNRDETMKRNASYPLKGEHPGKSSWENSWRSGNKDDELDARRMTLSEEDSSEAVEGQGVAPTKMKSPESVGNFNVSDDFSVKKFEHAASTFPEALAPPKDSSLIQKIEGLNAKTRAFDERQDVKSVSNMEEQKNKLQVGNGMVGHSAMEAGMGSFPSERSYVSGIINSSSNGDHFFAGNKSLESTVASGTAISRRSTHIMHSRADHRAKGRYNTQETDGWRKKSQIVDPQSAVPAIQHESSSVHMQDHNSLEATQNVSYHLGMEDGEPMPPIPDPSDNQRARKMELAKRLKQREKEEEERTKEQRAKAFAKLEELNRRTQAGDGATQKLETVPTSAMQSRQEESLNLAHQSLVTSKSGAANSSLGPNLNTIAVKEKLETVSSSVIQSGPEESTAAVVAGKSRASSSALGSSISKVAEIGETSVNRSEKSVTMVGSVPLGPPKIACNESVVVHEQSKPFQQDVNNAVAAYCSSTMRVSDSSTSKQKRMDYRQKHNGPFEKNSNENSSSFSTIEVSKGHIDTFPDSVADEIVSNSEPSLPVNSSVTAESSGHHRRNRSGKNKHKGGVPSSAALVSSVVSKDISLDMSAESVKPKTSESISDSRLVESPTDSNDANQSSELRLANEETHTRANNQWKSQHPCRMMKNAPGNKTAEKHHNGDAVVWAPVRSQNKTEVSDEGYQNNLVEAVVLSTKSDQQVQNNPRNKRAEIERYIVKPVAKELSQQSSHQTGVPPSNQMTSDETAERSEPGFGGTGSSQTSGTAAMKVGPAMESRSGDFRQNKSGKVHGSWRQRGAAELTAGNMNKGFQKSIEDHLNQKSDASSMKEQQRNYDEWNASDGWNMPENPDTAIPAPVSKDQGATARGKRQSHKGHKSTGYNHNADEKRTSSGDTEKVYIPSVALEMHQIDLPAGSKENHAVGERSTSHWKLKSQSMSASNQRGIRPNSNVNIGADTVNKNDSAQCGERLLPQPGKDTSIFRTRSHHDDTLSEKGSLEEAPTILHQEPKRERKLTAQREHPSRPVESSSSSNVDVRNDHCMSSGFRKNGNQNSRFGREHESRGYWSGSGKDNKQYNVPAIRERHRHNSHYEYQPVGPQNNNKANNFEPLKDGSHNSGGRYRERGQSHSRRGGGNLYGRQSGSIEVDAGYE